MRSFTDFSINNILYECSRHVDKMKKARTYLALKMPLNGESFKLLNKL